MDSPLTRTQPANRLYDLSLLAIFSITLFLSAGLLFLVQPLFARMLLPLLGGAPAVWNTAMVFYQAVLLLAYAYAHASIRFLGLRRQVLLHAALLTVPFLLLPIGVPDNASPPPGDNPIPWVFAALFLGVGAPLFVVSTTGPLMQRWFSGTGHRDARDPYFLYVASNAGSVFGLLAYPLFVEILFPLDIQASIWSWGYVVFTLLVAGCGIALLRGQSHYQTSARNQTSVSSHRHPASLASPPPTTPTRLRWLLFSFLGSSLMLGITTHVTTNVAALPFLWILPLTLYLITFMLVFSRRTVIPHHWVLRAFPIAMTIEVLLLSVHRSEPMLLVLSAHLIAFFILTLACHGELARTRPDPAHLTGFYLLLSAGGVMGGVFNALLAPALFNRLIEYPLTLVLVCLALLPAFGPNPSTKTRIASLIWPSSIGLLTYLLFRHLRPFEIDYTQAPATVPVLLALPAFLSFFLSKRGVQFALAAGAIFLVSNLHESFEDRLLFSQRSFFGVHRVVLDHDHRFHLLYHGKTFHGQQSTDPLLARHPVAYYHPSGPIGQLFNTFVSFPNNHVAIVGLGTGALAAYSKPHERWTFYELDPVVSSIASNPSLFTFLRDASAPIDIILGDARLSLASAPNATYGLIILDAYSSSAIPVHLLTREAIQLYLQKLAPCGILAFHVSNVHLSLTPVVATLAHDAQLYSLHRIDDGSAVDGRFPSEWVLLARNESDLAPIAQTGLWRELASHSDDEIWTDGHSAVARAIWDKLRNRR
jgi:hypothetical protein